MKIPRKPAPLMELLKKEPESIFRLLEKPEILQLISHYNKEYIHWDQLRHRSLPEKPEYIWALLKIIRLNQSRKLKFDKWLFTYTSLEECQRRLHLLDKGAAGNLETGIESAHTSGKERYILSSLMEEAIASSQLEGAATTRIVAKQLLRSKKKPRNFSEKMIVNGFRTIQKIIKMKNKEVTPEMILEIHEEITKDALKNQKDAGHFRDNNDVVVGDSLDADKIYHQPPKYKDLPRLIREFCEFASKDDGEFIHPIVKGIILHFLIGYLHPFNDGNGRTARSIFYWYVLSRGYWLFEYMAISRILLRSRSEYSLAYLYTETDDNDLTYFITYNLEAIEEALIDMQKYIARKQKEQIEAMELIKRIKNINLRQAEILKEFIKHPDKMFVITEIVTTYKVAYDTARNDLLYLTKLGYLEKVKIQKKFIFRIGKLKKE